MIDRKLSMQYVAGCIAESFKTDLFVIWSEDNFIRCQVLGSADKEDDGMGTIKRTSSYDNSKTHHAQFSQPPRCKRNQASVLDAARRSSYHRRWEHPRREKQRVGADGVNLKTVMCIDSVDFMRTYSNSCLEIFNVLSEAVDLYALRVFQLQGAH